MKNDPNQGSCLCGAVKYEVSPPFLMFRYCHCPRCRKHTGSAHAANLFVASDQLKWLSGEDAVTRYDLPEAKRFARNFCNTCGSPVPFISRDGTQAVIPAGSLDDDPGILPTGSIFWDDRAPWYQCVEEMPRHAGYPPTP
jgi:hypothetical protein